MEVQMEQAQPGRADAVRREHAGPSGAADAGASSALSEAARRANAGPHASSLAALQAVVAQRACADCETVRRTMGGGAPVQRARSRGGEPVQRAANEDGALPGELRAGLEHLSGRDLSGVRVNYDSPRPAQLNAHAVAQGPVIDVGPGKEEHLAHEGWHAVQQMQHRVRPTMDLDGTPVNDDAELEREADVMGARALAAGRGAAQLRTAASPAPQRTGAFQPVQRKFTGKRAETVQTPAGAISKATGIPGDQLKLQGVQPVRKLERAHEVSAEVDRATLRKEDRVDHRNLKNVTGMARAEQTVLQGAEAPGFYHAGHLIADFLVGSSPADDRFAMWNLAPQVAELNTPTYFRVMETDVQSAAEGGATVEMKVTLEYPDEYTVTPR